MRAILVLYLVAESTPDAINPGLNWETGAALSLYGTYTMLVYVASIPGGWIADNILGQKKIRSLWWSFTCIRPFNFSY
jgi:POT family proton-dependent oligopeptide transporter